MAVLCASIGAPWARRSGTAEKLSASEPARGHAVKTPDPGTPRRRDAASLLPVLGVFLLMPPVITLFTGAHTWLGVPLIVAYLFGVWLALIIIAALLAWRLGPPAAPPEDAAPGPAPTDEAATR